MSDKKHIDRLFQERFKDFEAAPSNAVWKNIEAELGNKENKKVIPIWWRYAGIAALLLLFLTLGIQFFNNEITSVETPTVVDNNKTSEPLKTIENTNASENIESINSKNHSNTASSENLHQDGQISSAVASTKPSTIEIISHPKISNASNYSKSIKESASEENSNVLMANTKTIESNTPEGISQKQNLNQNNQENTIAKTENKNENQQGLTIEEAIENSKTIAKNEVKTSRWSIAPNVAPVYFNSLGEGSSLDQQFVKNSKTGEVNMSYGINASYAINDKIKIRSGVNRVNLGYNTNDVVVYESTAFSSSSSFMKNVNTTDIKNNESTLTVISSNNISEASKTPETFKSFNTSLNQSFGFIEVPLEIEYTITNNKLGINVIGGFSSLFLNNNEVYSQPVNGSRMYIGEAVNIKNVSYSANLGLGLNYKVTKKLDLNLEPMFKYQINTFENTSGDFKPYFIGVYSGFSIKF